MALYHFLTFCACFVNTIAALNTCSNVSVGYDVNKVAARAKELASHSWEYGTAAEAFLELYNPELSVFGDDPFPMNDIPQPEVTSIPSLVYAKPVIRTDNQTLIDGDGAVGDPASLGVSAVLIGQSNTSYYQAATREADYVVNVAPRYWNGAISQRYNVAEIWADFVYMAPPFLAYYAVSTNDTELLKETVRQCSLYKQVLQANITANATSDYSGLWTHIIGPESTDLGLWSTGNAWAAAGMTRVLATVSKWGPSSGWTEEQSTLKFLIKEIIDGAMHVDKSNGLLRNYLNDTTWYGETSGTALLTSVVYRMAVAAPEMFGSSYISWADENRAAIAAHVTSNGTLSPAINPLNWGDTTPYTAGSPEGQSFGVLLYTAYRDCFCAGVCP
ncbi:MAG: hypothetical protein M1834_005188 [Cirrosporium novae-zelandiae]|nr:MAG: hypothetical protein M1834_005188 [Cirrosporium novae-zelandiae]